MSRSARYATATILASLLPVAAASGRDGGERPLAAVVASGARATVAFLPDGSWRVELPFLDPGDTDPAISPDGTRIAFVSKRDGNEEVYVADAGTGEVERLTRSARAEDRRPAWSPSGRRIVWQSGPREAADLLVMRADGTAKMRLVGGPGDDVDPAWSPDGTLIAFSSDRGGRRQLWTVAATGGEPQQLVALPGRTRAPAWAPGGRRLVFSRETARDSDIWVLELGNGRARKLTRGRGRDSRPDWSPNGERIAFARVRAGRSAIWAVGLDGAPARPLEGTDGLADPDWARAPRFLVPRPDERLPDLDQRAPAELAIVGSARSFRLGFASSTQNRGLGPLVLHGVGEGGRELRAHQIVELRDGETRLVRDVGRMRYEPHSPHRHWHLKSFVAYELRRASDFAVVAHDGKSGFCLVDRWGTALPRVPGSGPPRFVGDCAAGQPRATRVVQGTSVGYVDRYPAFFHGQELDVTGLPAGRYVLVHRANPRREMRELSYSNNGASVLLRLTWPSGRSSAPRLTVLRRCEASERCHER